MTRDSEAVRAGLATPSPLRARSRWERPVRIASSSVLLGLALLMALASFTYPFGRDQATHGYIGLRWLEGAIPYRDTFDIKPPGVFFAHLLAFRLFGAHMGAIRVLDLCASVIPGALLLGRACHDPRWPRGARLHHLALTASFHALLYFGTFDFWCTAQSETWCNLVSCLAIGGAAAADRKRVASVALMQGVAAAGMLLFKPPALVISLACIAFVLHALRAGTWRATSTIWLRFAANAALGSAAVLAPVLGYFAAHRGLTSMYEVLVITTARYARTGSSAASFIESVGEIFMAFSVFSGIPLLLVTAAVVRLRTAGVPRRTRARYRLGLTALAAAVLAVAVQRKFFLYHWVLAVPPLTFLASTALADARAAFARRRGGPGRETGLLALLAVALLGGGDGSEEALHVAALAPDYLRSGRLEAFDPAFDHPGFYGWIEYRRIAAAIARRSAPTDSVLVRGFEPQLYVLADRRYQGRHFWSLFVAGSVFSMPALYGPEDCRAFLDAPPRLVVAFNTDRPPIEDARTYEKIGYRRVDDISVFAVLERIEPPIPLERCPW